MVDAPKCRVAALVLLGLAICSTLLALVPLNFWWIRGFDFPKVLIALLLVVALLGLGVCHRRRRLDAALALLGASCLVYQCYRVYPYTALATLDIPRAETCDVGLRLMTANVLMSNRDVESFLEIVRSADPDVLFIVETDAWWDDALRGLDADYPHRVAEPLDNTYGLHLYSRFPLEDAEVRYLIEDDIPSVRARIRLGQGRDGPQDVVFFGVHPRPPRPGSDTEQRDGELITVAREVSELTVPAIVAGDLNDVAWSATTRLFREVGGLHDPRIGRGMYASYHADYPFFRWPLDHAFATESMTLRELVVLPFFGSDHFPLLTHFCYGRTNDVGRNVPEEVPAEVAEDADDAVEEAHEAERSDADDD